MSILIYKYHGLNAHNDHIALSISGGIFIYIVWKTFISLIYKKSLSKQIQMHKLDAFKATVLTLKHEFNNTSASLLNYLDMLDNNKCNENNQEKIKQCVIKLLALIKQINYYDGYNETEYLNDKKMVNIK